MYVKHPVAAVTSSLDYLVLMIQKCVNTSYHEIVNYWYIFLTLSGLNSSFLMRWTLLATVSFLHDSKHLISLS